MKKIMWTNIDSLVKRHSSSITVESLVIKLASHGRTRKPHMTFKMILL